MPTLDINQIRNILPQAYPFAFIDRVEDYKEGESLTAVKNITVNEWPFKGQTGPVPVFPATLLIEAAAQAALVLYHVSRVKDRVPRPRYFIGKCEAVFSGPVEFGTRVRLNVTAGKLMDTGGYADVEARTGDKNLAKMTIFFGVKG